MATADLDVIKEIPGYKVILKAVLKSQIQQLVTQLAASTDEESVILTASVSDGTLSHLGSESGKGFLENHEDIKSQFLGFCLRSHHKKKQEEKERQAAELLQQSTQASPGVYPAAAGPFTPEISRFSFLGQRSVHPVALTRVSPRTHIRPPGVRHAPYTLVRPPRRNSQNSDTSPAQTTESSAGTGPVVKTEPSDDSAISNQSESDTLSPDVSDQLGSQSNKPEVSVSLEPGTTDNDAVSNCSTSTFPHETGQNVDSDGANISSGNTQQNSESEDVDTNVCVKLEEIDEDDMDLEIIGVEPGKLAESKDNWDSNVSVGMSFDAIGATGSQGDMAAQGYNEPKKDVSMCRIDFASSSLIKRHARREHNVGQLAKTYPCSVCGKTFGHAWVKLRHERAIHANSKQHICDYCKEEFSYKWQLKHHLTKEHNVGSMFECRKCHKQFAIKCNYETHLSICTDQLKERISCPMCQKTFRNRESLRTHKRVIHTEEDSKPKHICYLCGRCFGTNCRLRRHLQSKMHISDTK